MPERYSVVIADTSCIILLDEIDELILLQKLFGAITTTFEIAREFGKELPDWVLVKTVTDIRYQALLEFEIDKGEASAITLAVESNPSLLIIDDLKARKLADKLNLLYTGTLGVIIKAKEQGLITKIKPILEKIQLTNFRLSAKIYNEIITIVGE